MTLCEREAIRACKYKCTDRIIYSLLIILIKCILWARRKKSRVQLCHVLQTGFPRLGVIFPVFPKFHPISRKTWNCVNFKKKLRECVNFEKKLRECVNFGPAGGGARKHIGAL